jgi:hypothetical protein
MKKATWIALGVFAVLLVVVLARRETQVNVGVPKLALPTFTKDKVKALDISGPVTASLVKEGEEWKVFDPAKPDAKFVAEPQQVASALDAIARFLLRRSSARSLRSRPSSKSTPPRGSKSR